MGFRMSSKPFLDQRFNNLDEAFFFYKHYIMGECLGLMFVYQLRGAIKLGIPQLNILYDIGDQMIKSKKSKEEAGPYLERACVIGLFISS